MQAAFTSGKAMPCMHGIGHDQFPASSCSSIELPAPPKKALQQLHMNECITIKTACRCCLIPSALN